MRASRRRFLSGSAMTGTAALLAPAARVLGANERVAVGVIGTGGQGIHHVEAWGTHSDVSVAYVCDVDDARLANASRRAPAAACVTDMRRVLDDPGVDLVSIATPDHWHIPAALLALEAGKHVYIEKPCSHNVKEGRLLVEAAGRTGKLVQHGTQSRSSAFIRRAIELLQAGLIGDLVVAKAWNIQYRPPIGRLKPGEPPAGLDYDAWVGPAPMVPYQANRLHYTWHWWRAFGTGDAGNDGVHDLDIARWGLGVDTHPSLITAVGGKYVHDDDQEFPDTMTAVFEYPGNRGPGSMAQIVFEMRLWTRNAPGRIDNGNEFLGTKGRMLLSKRGDLEAWDADGNPLTVELPDPGRGPSVPEHQRDFLDAIRSSRAPNADARTAHLSSALPHLANLACRVGRAIHFDPASEQILGDPEANAQLARDYRRGYWATPT